MSTAAASRPSGGGPAPFALDRSDRLDALFAPMRGMPRVMTAVLVGSVALHLVLVATAIVTSRAPPAIPDMQETPVEVVQEVPKEAPKEAPKPPPVEMAKAEPPKAPEQAAPPPPEPQKQVATSEAVKAVTEERETLLKELAALRAQEAKLEAKPAATAAPPPAANLGMGPLPDSFQAVALPSSTEGAGEAMDYKEIVFSQLAKAKGLDERMGLPGTAGVGFSIDTAGRLVHVAVVRPSGVAALDREAIEIVRRAAPFPPPPQGAQRSFVANVNFVAQGKP